MPRLVERCTLGEKAFAAQVEVAPRNAKQRERAIFMLRKGREGAQNSQMLSLRL